jgi:glucosamine--fructose-6-phosphate aminotransferase (isomerizing)
MNGEYMAAEIREQPAVLARILREARSSMAEIGAAIKRRHPRFVLFVARGTSDHAALYGKYLVEIELGLPAGMASPSTMTVYDAHPRLRDVLVIAVSQSGSSPDLIEPVTRARAAGAITVAVTNAPGSPLARAAELSIDVLAGTEQAVAATKSYTAELLALYLLVDEIGGRHNGEVERLPDQAATIIGREGAIAALATRYRFAEQLVTTARGYNYATAQEAALKLMETTYLVAQAFSSADLAHGPMAIIDHGFPVIAVVPPGAGGAAFRPVLERLHALSADTLIIGDVEAADQGTVGLALPELRSESLSPILTILPLQQFAWHLARERGVDPDQPRGLQKETHTW